MIEALNPYCAFRLFLARVAVEYRGRGSPIKPTRVQRDAL
jgi:hypothetical protein